MSLLTLDETTLYYYFLSDRTSNGKEKFTTGINNWAAAIPDNASTKVASASGPPSASISKLSNRSAHLPALTNATSRSSSSTSVLSKSVKISQNIKVKAEPQALSHDASIEINEFGLEDDDETMGVEREAALNSPLKGKTRVSSAVSKNFPPPHPLFTNLIYQKNLAGSC